MFVEMNPQCADIVDVWGKDGKVMVVWQQPHREKPQYYIVNYGTAQTTVGRRIYLRILTTSFREHYRSLLESLRTLRKSRCQGMSHM